MNKFLITYILPIKPYLMAFNAIVAIIALDFIISRLSAQEAWSYIGIPYVTDNVPGAIMPTLPTGADTAGWPYDPCTIATPTFTGGATQYYIDTVNGSDATPDNAGRGSVANPRQTFPNVVGEQWTMAEGTQYFITGNSSFSAASATITITANGTSANPCWIIGVGNVTTDTKPNFAGDKFFVNGSHLIVHNMRFQSSNGKTRIKAGESIGGPMDYFCLRYCRMKGVGTPGSGENAVVGGNGNISDASAYIVVYRCEISDYGGWNRQDNQGQDRHGIQPFSYTKYWWIIENKIYHMEGDSVQVATTGYNNPDYAYRPHYIYIAGNWFFENYENGIDTKNCFHMIASQNRMNTFYNAFKDANNTAVVQANNDVGWVSSYEWVIFNSIMDCNTGIKVDPDAAETLSVTTPPIVQATGQKCYIIGNVLEGCGINWGCGKTSPTGAGAETWSSECWIANNTILGYGINQNDFNSRGDPFLNTIVGNVFINSTTNLVNLTGANASQTDTVNYNVFYSSGGSITHDATKFDSPTGNATDSNPLLLAPSAGKMQITAASPAAGILPSASVPACYALFESMYGISIEKDFYGNDRPAGDWSAGAFEPGSGIAKGTGTTGTLTIGN